MAIVTDVALQEFANLVAAETNKIPTLITDIAPEYDEDAGTYAVGDLVIHDVQLYQCNAAVASPEAWDSSKWTSVNVSGVTESIKDDLEEQIDNKANVDGSYENMTVGQLISNVYANDETPYLFRTTGGSADVGDRAYLEKLVGGTIGWNQLAPTLDSISVNSVVTTRSYDSDTGVATLTATDVDNNAVGVFLGATSALASVAGHKYLTFATVKPSKNCDFYIGEKIVTGLTASVSSRLYYMGSMASTATTVTYYVRAAASSWEIGDSFELSNVVFFDLTAMFGSSVANYIYTLEQSTSGAGVALFRKWFPLNYYAYNTGTLLSTKASLKTSVGFNAWDEEWEQGTLSGTTGLPIDASDRIRSKNFCECLPSTVYGAAYPSGVILYILWYDANQNFISFLGFTSVTTTATSPANAYYFKISPANTYGGTYHNDICINLSWSGYRNGEYEPYVKYEYALPNVVLRGIPKLDANNNLYFDGDTITPDGTLTHKTNIYTFTGSESDIAASNFDGSSDYVILNLSAVQNGDTSPLPTNYPCRNMYAGSNTSYHQLAIEFTNGKYSSASEAIASLAGYEVLIPLATPTTETVDSYQETQIVDDFGTERFTCIGYDEANSADTTISIPMGHDTDYPSNLRDKLQRLPDIPDTESNYVVNYNDRQCSFVNAGTWLASSTTITEINTKIPDAPTTAGTYVLKATVDSDGNPTYAWVSE